MSNILKTEAARPNYLRAPNWRWNIALRCLIEGVLPEEVIRRSLAAKDKWLLEACRFYEDRQELVEYTGRLQIRFPVMHEAFMLFHDSRPTGGYKWLIEAMLMTDASDQDIANTFHPLYGADTIEMFRKVYFDIENYKSDPAAVFCTILATALQTTHSVTDCDFTWKAFAFARGFEAIQDLINFRGGADLSSDYVRFMREISMKRRYYNEYHQTASLRASFSHDAMALFDQADRLWNMQEARKRLGGDSDDEGSATSTANQILTALEQAFLDPDLEKRIAERSGVAEPTNNPMFVPDTALEEKMMMTHVEN